MITVLGARSGTSAMAGMLGMVGCTLPRTLMPGNFANERGYFEPVPVAAVHDAVLEGAGSTWSDWRAFPEAWFGSEAARYQGAVLAQVFAAEYGRFEIAVLKDPRMCRLLPLWDGVFEALRVDPVYCFVDRDPLDVAASLASRDGSSVARGLLYYVRNHLDSERATRGRRRVFTTYGALLADWRGTMAGVARVAGVGLGGADGSAVDRFIDGRLRHQRREGRRPGGVLTEMAYEVHRLFGRLAEGAGEEVHGGLDAVRAWFDGEAAGVDGRAAVVDPRVWAGRLGG